MKTTTKIAIHQTAALAGLMPETHTKPIVIYDKADKAHRNEPCRCGSGKKYKKCCMAKHRSTEPIHYYH